MKICVLDTNVLLDDPNSLLKFGTDTVVIPIYVVMELDNFKGESSERGRNARLVSRTLSSLMDQGNLSVGVATPDGGKILVKGLRVNPPEPTDMDSKILLLAEEFQVCGAMPDIVCVVSNDTNVRIRAQAMGLNTQAYEPKERNTSEELYTGMFEQKVPGRVVDNLYAGKIVRLGGDLIENSFINLIDEDKPSHTGLARIRNGAATLVAPKWDKNRSWGISPRNLEQRAALELLCDPEVKVVSLVGISGGGKTLLATAAGLTQVCTDQIYEKLLVARPIMPLGKDIGFIPGTISEKMAPWMVPIYDALECLGSDKGAIAHLIERGDLQVEPLTYIRGRSISNKFIILDESQQLSSLEVKAIITRVSEGTKIVLTGDPQQIDNPHLDSQSNGLVVTLNKFKGEKLFGHIVLKQGERSAVAEMATRLL